MSETFPVRLIWQPTDTPEPQELTAVLSSQQLSSLIFAARKAREENLEAVCWIPVLQPSGSVQKMLFRLRLIQSAERIKRGE